MATAFDIQMMAQAMATAQNGEGWVNPNPLVGAVIVRDGKVIAQGYHARYGDLHAERNAFKYADANNIDCTGTTMYVTLEPCCHHGHQPPCTEAIIAHRVKRVVVGLRDPNPLVAGKGMQILHDAGIEAEYLNDYETETKLKHQNRVFLKFITTGLPWVTAKWAMTLDGKIASYTGDSRWVSGEESRHYVHHMRWMHRAIMCGIGTVLADNPMLNVRGYDNARQPVRIVVDRRLRIPLVCQLVKTAHDIPLIVATTDAADSVKEEQLAALGVTIWHCPTLTDLMVQAGKAKIDSILLEGGGILNEAMLSEGHIDEVCAFIAPKIIGGHDALSPVEGMGIEKMADAVTLKDITMHQLGNDIMISGLTCTNRTDK